MSPHQWIESRLTECPGNPDDRKADQGGGILRLDRMQERGTEAFAPESAGAVEGTVDLDIALDLVLPELPETDAREIDVLENGVRPVVEQDDRRVKFHGLPAARAELLPAASGIAWLVMDLATTDRDLVGAENPGPGRPRCDGRGFRVGQAERARAWRLAGDGHLIDAG